MTYQIGTEYFIFLNGRSRVHVLVENSRLQMCLLKIFVIRNSCY